MVWMAFAHLAWHSSTSACVIGSSSMVSQLSSSHRRKEPEPTGDMEDPSGVTSPMPLTIGLSTT